MELVDQLLANPYLTTTRAVGFLNVSPQGAAYTIQRLDDAKVLQPGGQAEAARLYVAKEVLEVLEGP